MLKENIEIVIAFIVVIFISIGLFYYSYRKINKRLRNPEELLKAIEIQLSNKNIPNYLVVPDLVKAIKLNPNHQGLKNKLKQIESNTKYNSSPKTFYLVLAISIAILGVAHIFFWFTGAMNIYGVFLGVLFIFGAIAIYRQSLKEK